MDRGMGGNESEEELIEERRSDRGDRVQRAGCVRAQTGLLGGEIGRWRGKSDLVGVRRAIVGTAGGVSGVGDVES